MKQIGAKSDYNECADSPYNLVVSTGDVRIPTVKADIILIGMSFRMLNLSYQTYPS